MLIPIRGHVPCTYDIHKIFRFFDPIPLFVRIQQLIYTIKFAQPPFTHLLFGEPLPLTVRTSYVHAPKGNKFSVAFESKGFYVPYALQRVV